MLFDVGHGAGSFDWQVAQDCADLTFWPDTISTDLHKENVDNLAKSLAHVISKFLTLGMSIQHVSGNKTYL